MLYCWFTPGHFLRTGVEPCRPWEDQTPLSSVVNVVDLNGGHKTTQNGRPSSAQLWLFKATRASVKVLIQCWIIKWKDNTDWKLVSTLVVFKFTCISYCTNIDTQGNECCRYTKCICSFAYIHIDSQSNFFPIYLITLLNSLITPRSLLIIYFIWSDYICHI